MAKMALQTYLSEYVHFTVVECGQNVSDCSKKCLTPQLTYDWQEIGKVLGDVTDDFDVLAQPDCWYRCKARLMWELVHSAQAAVSAAARVQRANLYQLCEWVCCRHDVADYHSGSVEDPLTVVLHLTAAFERALGNVYLTKNHPVPFLLRDLLRTPELRSIFGPMPILFAQLLLGSPKGLNLRNVAWHGFLSPGELHPHIVTALIILFASLGELIQSYQAIPKRPQFSDFDQFREDLEGGFPDVMEHRKGVLTMVQTSPHIPESFRSYWRRAFELYEGNRFGDSVTLLLPQLEHCLRVIYCRVNSCTDRLLTAESTVLYTTLDQILAPTGRPLLKDSLLMMLLDLTSSLTGPRLRDRLSHGECDLNQLPQWLANHVFGVALCVAHHQIEGGYRCCNIPLCSALQAASSRYCSCFHVAASLHKHTEIVVAQWAGWQLYPRPFDLQINPLQCTHIRALQDLLFPSTRNVTERVEAVRKVLAKDLLTLYRPRTELELAASLLRVTDCVGQTAEKVSAALMTRCQQWCNRTLRTRGRATFTRMWTVLPDLWSTLLSVLMLTAHFLHSLPTLAASDNNVQRLIKAMIKSVQNTVIQCDEERNRWTEAHSNLSHLAQLTLQWLSKNSDLLPI